MNLKLIVEGCKQLDLHLSQEQIKKIEDYISLLVKWNKVYNLTAVTESNDIIVRHILDSLSIIKYIPNSKANIIDIGSGAGLPGVIVAIVNDQCRVTLLDSNSKRTTFLEQLRIRLKLKNLTVVNERCERFAATEKFDTIIARAFADLTKFVLLTEHLVSATGIWLAMKGKFNDSELLNFNNECKNFKVSKVNKISVPFLSEERHLIEISHS